MGNHGSRKEQKKWGKQGGKAARALSRVEELRGPPVDSYDKLIAWLAEMAETDNVELDTSVFVSQLSQVCRERSQDSRLGVAPHTGTSSPRGTGSTLGGNRAPFNSRQNSTSCDSHASSDVTQRNRSSTRSDDFLDPSSAWKSAASTRQNTFSDDLEGEESDLRNASVESLYSGTDRDSELGSLLAYDASCRRNGRGCNFQSSSPLLRVTLARRYRSGGKGDYTLPPHSASSGNLDLYAVTSSSSRICCLPKATSVKKSASMLDLLPQPEPVVRRDAIPKLILTQDNNVQCDIKPSPENTMTRHRKKLGSGPKSLSLTSGRGQARTARFERQFSLHCDPRPFAPLNYDPRPSSSFGCDPRSSASFNFDPRSSASLTCAGILPHVTTLPPAEIVLPAPLVGPEAAIFLNDDLLDRNIADILFSVEALWPKK